MIPGPRGGTPLAVLACLCLGLGSAAGRADEPPRDDQAQVRRLIAQLEEAAYPRDRTRAADQLGDLGPNARDAVPALLRAVDTGNDFSTRDEAVKALGAIAPEDPAVLRRLAELLADRTDNGEIAATARRTLVRVGAPAIAVLVEKLETRWDEQHEDDLLGTWGWAAVALAEIGRPALPAVLEALGDPSRRFGAVEALRGMGRAVAAEATPALVAHAIDTDSRVRCSVFQALQQMGPADGEAARVLTIAARENGSCGELAAQALSVVCPSCAPPSR